MGKEMNKTAIRNRVANDVCTFLREHYETDVLPVASGKFMMPIVDDEGEEGYITIQFTFPRGKRVDGTYCPYNGYDEAEAYRVEVEADNAEKEAKRKDKERAEKEKERKRSAKKTVKRLNTEGLDKMIHSEE